VLGAGGKVWIDNHPVEGWTPGTVDSVGASGAYVVVDEHGEQFEVPQEKARAVDSACLRGVDDLLALGDFNEGALLHNVRVRYFRDEIYTGIGSPILISVNPFANLPGLYNETKQKFYRDRAAAAGAGDVQVPPHLFSVVAAAHTAMLGDSKNQSIIISGESGAGKTEATKRILAYFANIQKNTSSHMSAGGMSIEDQVLRSNPILEAFGNAKTVRNDNSSRFGKYIDIEFDTAGKLQSAKISNYLLEKVRIIKQQPNERGYHAFYQLCAGAEKLGFGTMLHLSPASHHAYTECCTDIEGVNDIDNFEEMVECMDSLGFTTEEKNSVFKITAAVLHLGDMAFQACDNSQDGCKICDTEMAGRLCQMLHVDSKDFTKVFQYKTLEDPFTKKIIDMPQEESGSSNTRHSMAKTLYSRLFDWLVWRINQSTMAQHTTAKCHKIGILDIYGFEVFEWNSFEQLCINFANEKLQQHFNSHMFTLEQQLYTEEGIGWSHITFQDNREIIDTLERKPLGLFCIVDSECLMPNATDTSCLNKIYNSFKTSKICYKPSRFASTNFAVAHYAGEVVYDIISFLEKNTDKLHADIINLMKTSNMPLLKSLFTDPKFAPELASAAGAAGAARGGAAAKGRPGGTLQRGTSGGVADNQRAKQNVTVSMMFRQQLDQLVEDLNKTNPRYIRCIKPNALKQAHEFDSIDVQRQLRCAGMLESIRIRRAGYSVRRPFKEFFNRFRVLCPSLTTAGQVDPDYKELSRKLLTDMEAKLSQQQKPLEPKSWQIGRSKVFLKEELQGRLEKSIGEALKSFVILIQKRWRGFREKKRFKAIKKASLQVQAALRTLRSVVEYQERKQKHDACVTLQATLRMSALRNAFVRRRAGALRVQRVYRGWRCRQKVGKLKGKMAAERIQKMREEEEQKKALEAAKQAAQEKERALEEMQKQMALERERAQEEARAQIEEAQRMRQSGQEQERKEQLSAKQADQLEEELARLKRENMRLQGELESRPVAQAEGISAEAQQQLEKMRQEMLELRKTNAKLQGQLEAGVAAPASSHTEAEVEQLRREVQELRRDKVRLEVDLATAKSAEEYDALSAEAGELREECSNLRRAKLDAELQLEQRSAQLDASRAQAARLEQTAQEINAMRIAHDDLQVQFQRISAQKSALEERSQGDEVARTELRQLRLEKMRLEGELETSKMKEAAISEKLKNSERAAIELQQQRQRLSVAHSELDVSKQHVASLKEQVAQLTRDSSASRSDSLEQLRSELLSRIETQPRPSLLPGGNNAAASIDAGLAPDGERKTLLNQRAIFEQLKQQFQEAKDSSPVNDSAPLPDIGVPDPELEEELRRVRKENVDLNIRIESLQDELRHKQSEATTLCSSSGAMQAEIQDLRFQLEQEFASSKRQAADIADLQDKLAAADSEASSARGRLVAAEENFVRAEEENKAAQLRCRRLEDDMSGLERRAQELQSLASDSSAQREALAAELEAQQAVAEQCRSQQELAERGRLEAESSLRFLESENERVKAELLDAQMEKTKIKQIMDDLVQADLSNKAEELKRDIEKYKTRAAYFEREYNNSKQLNSEMTKVMSQMTQAVAERSDEKSDMSAQNRMLHKQLEAKTQELRSAKVDRDEVQKQLDALQSSGNFYQDRYRDAQEELRSLRHEHSISSATSAKLKSRVESLQKEVEDLKAQIAKSNYEARASADDVGKVDRYESHLRELQQKLRAQDEELDRSQAFAAKSQAVNDCLNTLLVLESEQTSLYESAFEIKDSDLLSQFDQKKSKAQSVISRLNQIMTEEERPSIAYMDKRYG